MKLVLQPVRVATGAEEDGLLVFEEDRLLAVLVRLSDANEVAPGAWFLEAGFLVFDDGRLVAVLVQLSDENEIAPGEWFFEAGFGGLDGPDHPSFKDIDGAQAWIGQRLTAQQAS